MSDGVSPVGACPECGIAAGHDHYAWCPTLKRFVSPCDPPEGRVRELLVILMEEAAAVQQRAAKMLRFGVDEVQPGQPDTNATRLAGEIGDFTALVHLLEEADVLNPATVATAITAKKQKLAKWLQSEEQP